MYAQLLGLAAGTTLGAYGEHKKKKAMRGAENAYMQRVQQLMQDQHANNMNALGQEGAMSDEHNQDLSGALGNWMGADQAASGDTGYAANAQSTVDALRGKTEMQGPAGNGAAQAAIAQQAGHAQSNLGTALQAGASEDQQRRLGVLRQNALTPYTQGEMARSSKLQRLQQQFQLRNAMLQNGFSLDQARLQNDMNAAGKAGDHAIMWGSLLQNLGGSSMGADAYQPNYAQQGGQAPNNLENGGWAGYDYPQGNQGGMYA